MAAPDWGRLLALGLVTTVVAGVALVPEFYHRWWWWDVLMHSTIAGLLGVWRHTLDVPPRVAWPALVVGMLAWEWLELSTPLLFSPTRADVLKDLTVNVVAFGTVSTLLGARVPHGESARSRVADDWT